MGKKKKGLKLSVQNILAGLFVLAILWGAWQALGGASLAGTSEITLSPTMQQLANRQYLYDQEEPGVFVVAVQPLSDEPTEREIEDEIRALTAEVDSDAIYDQSGNLVDTSDNPPSQTTDNQPSVKPARQSIFKTWWQTIISWFKRPTASVPTAFAADLQCGPNCPLPKTTSTKRLMAIITGCEAARKNPPSHALQICRSYATATKMLAERQTPPEPISPEELRKLLTKRVPPKGPFHFESRKINDGSGVSREVMVYVNSGGQTAPGFGNPDFGTIFSGSGDSATLSGDLTGIIEEGGWEAAPWLRVSASNQPAKPSATGGATTTGTLRFNGAQPR
jgi:hypothetical protein